MLDFLKKLVRFKRVDLESKLRPTPECTFGGIGEVEVEIWSDGTASLEASLKHSSVPNGSDLDIYWSGSKLITLPVAGGFAKQVLIFSEDQSVPEIKAGDEAELRLGDQVLYRGSFRRD